MGGDKQSTKLGKLYTMSDDVSLFTLLDKNSLIWVTYNQQKCISHSSKNWETHDQSARMSAFW